MTMVTKVQPVPRHPHMCRYNVSLQNTIYPQVTKNDTLCPDVKCLCGLYYQYCSHFMYIKKTKTEKLFFFLTICQLLKRFRKRHNIVIIGRGFHEYRLQYKSVIQVVAHEACMCSLPCSPINPHAKTYCIKRPHGFSFTIKMHVYFNNWPLCLLCLSGDRQKVLYVF